MLKDFSKSALRQTGLLLPIQRLKRRLDFTVPFHTLSPDLLVALVRAFDAQPHHEGRAYYEFGLYQGFSIWFAEQISRGRVPDDFLLHGFDSFAGLPDTEVDRDYYIPGEFSASYENVQQNLIKYNADMRRIRLHKGFYSAAHFAALEASNDFPPISIAVIDVDIYESCVSVLEFLRPRLEAGSIVIFDDYNDMSRSDAHGERKALREFNTATGMELKLLFEIGRECAAFEVTKAPRPAAPR